MSRNLSVATAVALALPHTREYRTKEAGTANDDIVAVKSELTRIGGELKEFATKAKADVQQSLTLSTEAKSKIDELLSKQAEAAGRLAELEQKLVALKSGPAANEAEHSLGQRFCEDEGVQKALAKGTSFRGSVGFKVKAITSLANSAGDAVRPDRIQGIITPPERRMTVRDLLTAGRTSSNMIEYVKETGFTNNADIASEGTLKPESSLTFDLVQAAVVVIAHWIKASKQIMADVPQLESYIDGRLRYGLMFKEEAQLLMGSGLGGNLNGVYTQATAFARAFDVPHLHRIDELRLALLQAELAEFPATGIVLNPTDWAQIELTKDTTGAYIFANPQALAGPVLWGRPVVSTQAMPVSDFLTGAFKLGAQVFDREDANVVLSTEDQDNFVKNMVTILAEERLTLAVYRPEAFIKGGFTGTSG